ncbi:unnamed protein product [Discosporangium mesarthrocarpum]
MGRGGRDREARSKWRSFVNALQSNQNFEYLYWCQIGIGLCFDWFMRLIGPLLLVFATTLISAIICLYFRFILPSMAAVGTFAYNTHAVVAFFLAFNVFFNYYHCAFTHPGKPLDFLHRGGMDDESEECDSENEETSRPLTSPGAHNGGGISRVNVGSTGGGGSAGAAGATGGLGVGGGATGGVAGGGEGGGMGEGGRGRSAIRCGFCKKCREPKPARAHHCHICDMCILNMDHHCPWMNNCVGYLNYRYFVLFLMYMWLGCLYAVLCTGPRFMSMATSGHVHRKTHGGRIQRLHPLSFSVEGTEKSAIMVTFILSLSVGIAISILFFWHIYLILSAQTTIEFYQNQGRRARARHWGELFSNPFDVGCVGNWQQVFGPGHPLLGILPSRRKPPPPIIPFFEWESSGAGRGRGYGETGEWVADPDISGEHIV